MTWQKEFIEILRSELEKRKKENPSYSMRSFAQSIGLGSGPLSELLKGSRIWNFSVEWALKIVNQLSIEPYRKRYLEALMGLTPSQPAVTHSKEFPEIDFSEDVMMIPCFVLYQNLSEEAFRKCAQEQLNVPAGKVDGLVARMKGLSDAQRKQNDNVHFRVSSSDEPELQKLKRHLENDTQIVRNAVDAKSSNEYEIKSVTFQGSKERFELLQNEIHKLVARAPALLDGGPENDQVYRFSISIVPF